MFVPDGPCYECTMSDRDWAALRLRRSCNLLSRPQMEGGKTPTTPTIGSIVAGVQCQEAVKLLHGLPTMAGHGWVFIGLTGESFQVRFQRKRDCYSHETLDEVVPLDAGAAGLTVGAAVDLARKHVGPEAELELSRDVLAGLDCPACGGREERFMSLGKAPAGLAVCPGCGGRRDVRTFCKLRGGEPFRDRTLADVGVPPLDVLVARAGDRAVGFELSGDAPAVLGPLVDGEEALQWT